MAIKSAMTPLSPSALDGIRLSSSKLTAARLHPRRVMPPSSWPPSDRPYRAQESHGRLGVPALLVHLRRAAVVTPDHHEEQGKSQAEHPGDHEDHPDDLEIHMRGLPGHAEPENRADNDQGDAGTDRHRNC